MKVMTTYFYGNYENNYRDSMQITFDGEKMFSVKDGEPEDSNMSRNFNDVRDISMLLRYVYFLGKEGKKVIFEEKTV